MRIHQADHVLRVRGPARVLLVFLGGAVASCGGELVGFGPPTPVALSIIGDPVVGVQNGDTVRPAPTVQLVDRVGRPVELDNVPVVVRVTSGGGTLGGDTLASTDGQGRAVFSSLSMSGPAGPKSLTFSSPEFPATVSITLSLEAGPPAMLAAGSPQNQVTGPGTQPVPPVVRVTDAGGNGVAGVPVRFTVGLGGGVVVGDQQVSGPDGRAAPDEWILGPGLGLNTLIVSSPGLPEFTFITTSLVELPATITVTRGEGQYAAIGAPVSIAPRFYVGDAHGGPITYAPVTIRTEGGGTASLEVEVTLDDGEVRIREWQLGLQEGEQRLIVEVGTASAVLTATARAFRVSSITAGTSVCAQDAQIRTLCWGRFGGPLGDGDAIPGSTPVAVAGGHQFTQVTVGLEHTCALDATGAAWCWGTNPHGELGTGGTASALTPAEVTGGHRFTQLDAYRSSTCGVRIDRAVLCWGSGEGGKLGQGDASDRTVPTVVPGGPFRQVALGAFHACALALDGTVWCWGTNAFGQLGDNTFVDRATPTPVVGGQTYTMIGAGGQHSCGLTTAGEVFCWGYGPEGELGNGRGNLLFLGAVDPDPRPGPVLGSRVYVDLSVGSRDACARTADNRVWCWGNFRLGGTEVLNYSPAEVPGGLRFTSFTAGDGFGCGVATTGVAYCWGTVLPGVLGHDDPRELWIQPEAVRPPPL